MLSSSIIGRQGELAVVDEFLSQQNEGFACLSVEGEAGVGKTTIWQAALERARDRGVTVLACRPAQVETPLAFAGLGDLLAGVDEGWLADLPVPQRHALDVALLRVEAAGQPPDPRAVPVAVVSVLRRLAASQPVLVAVDDVQWLDGPTAGALEFAARRLDREPIGLLPAVRTGQEPLETFDRAVTESRRQAIRLGGLSLGALHELLTERLQHNLSRPMLVKIAEATAGNPFYALEIARELLRAGEPKPGAPLPVPADLRELIARRVRRLPDRTREALLVAAALAHPTTRLVDEAALELAEEAEMVRVGDDGRIAFRHPLYASAVYDCATAGRRRMLHRWLADVVDEEEERAHHVALATVPPDEAVAQALEQAAARARARGAWQSAAELLEQAQTFTAPDQAEAVWRRGIAAAEHHVHAGDRRRASVLLEQLLAGVPGGWFRAEVLRLLGEIRQNDDRYLDALRLLEDALQHATQARQIVEIELALTFTTATVSRFEDAVVHAERAAALTAPIPDKGLQAEALACLAMAKYCCGRGVDWGLVEEALALEDPNRVAALQRAPGLIAGSLLMYVGRLSEARDRLITVRDRAVEHRDESDVAFVLATLVWLETQSGNFQLARGLAEEAGLLATLTASKMNRAWVHAQSALLSAHQGDIDRVQRECAGATAMVEHTAANNAILWIVAARCLAELSAGNAAAAWCAAEPVALLAERYGIGEPVGLPFLPDALEALIECGELDRAARLLNDFHRRAQELDRVWALATGERCRGLLLAARGELSAASDRFEQALVHHAQLEMPFELARTLLCLGRLQRRRKLHKEARQTLGRALEIFDQLGSPLWAEKTRGELKRTHIRESLTELTPTQQRVAELAGSGLTNKHIAERLFLSPKTVEANLARVYIKLGIASRAELGAKMATSLLRDERR